MNDHMELSRAGAEFIAEWEGLKLQVYLDAAGYPTIGIGHLIRDGENYSDGLTREEAFKLFADDVAVYEDAVKRHVAVPLTQGQFDALVSWTYNLGEGNLRKSTLLRAVNERDVHEVPHQMMRWTKAGGRPLRGLERRRAAEAILWTTSSPTEPLYFGPDVGIRHPVTGELL